VEAERCFSSIEESVHEPDLTIRRVKSAAPADARRCTHIALQVASIAGQNFDFAALQVVTGAHDL